MTYSIGHLAAWILVHRNRKAFNGYTWDTIYQQLAECARNKTMCFVVDGPNITGVCCGKVLANKKVFYVDDILAEKKGTVKKMLQFFIKKYPGFSIEGKHRSGRTMIFSDPKQLMERIK